MIHPSLKKTRKIISQIRRFSTGLPIPIIGTCRQCNRNAAFTRLCMLPLREKWSNNSFGLKILVFCEETTAQTNSVLLTFHKVATTQQKVSVCTCAFRAQEETAWHLTPRHPKMPPYVYSPRSPDIDESDQQEDSFVSQTREFPGCCGHLFHRRQDLKWPGCFGFVWYLSLFNDGRLRFKV